jgi:hypothetical protein
MPIRPSLYKRNTNSIRNSHSSNLTGKELDLRLEMDEILYGVEGGPRHGNLVLLRTMRRDSDGYPTKCNCLANQTTVEPDFDCSYCLGEGYLWDETWSWSFWMLGGAESGLVKRYIRMPPGEIRVDYKIFFFRYDTNISYDDKIIEVKLDTEGEVELPYVREAIYKPQTIAKRRSDNGRIEYVVVFCKEDDAIKTDNPR